MIGTNRITMRNKFRDDWWPELQKSEISKPRPPKRHVMQWFSHLVNPTAPLCRRCHRRKLNLRSLVAKPPDISELPKGFENEDLNDLENKFSVHIHNFSAEEAEAAKSRCSLCALLSGCLEYTQQEGWLGYMRCTVILRPRFDRSTNIKKKGIIIHKQQIWVEFQPIEGEVLIDLVDVGGIGFTGRRRPVFPTADYKLLKWWLRNCNRKHTHPDISTEVRSRMQVILDDGLFRLINTSTGLVEVLASLPTFVALSYVWGPAPSQPKNQPLKGGPVADYPRTIRDTIVTANFLGYEWLWVDRLCIDQNSDTDKAKLIPYMRDIYAAANLTIVAACGKGAEDGLFGTEGTPRKARQPLTIGPSFAVAAVSYPFEGLIEDTVWYKRGWTFQECVFSRRLLFVLNSEMFFCCGDHLFRETTCRRLVTPNQGSIERWLFYEKGRCVARDLQVALHRKAATPDKMLNSWLFLSAMREYSGRKLSVGADRLAAFAGVILSAMEPMDQVSEAAFLKHGHPLPFFESLLTWTPGYDSGRLLNQLPVDNMPTPSWSWAHSGYRVNIDIHGETRGCYDQYYWFTYSQLPNYDVLGLPSPLNPIDTLLNMPLSDELKTDRSWAESSPQDIEKTNHDENLVTMPVDVSRLPKLHLLTLVFDARLVFSESIRNYKDSFLLMDLGSTDTPQDVSMRERGIILDLLPTWHLQIDREDYLLSPRPRPFETFAIITGWPRYGSARFGIERSTELYYDLTVMLLEPQEQKDTYSRLGLSTISNVFRNTYYVELIKKGNPRWQYIHIV
ncbi:heterokaryon incompatibility protein-domain-containing protein [Xylaria bambusicola]|uniref:heterokaryon incompatibility protein-domain-containing protein n=1 Tax=Xylaria bambusicola TaxID=326684 RepID=UPI0020077A05|nr:heterokaryon incompatibility protein-domain-containing protein [Xylaria bambusicola]KAI0526619.1 heterokaryon incompatibility protein-domain-containing protein [Xylaria bambusicola]